MLTGQIVYLVHLQFSGFAICLYEMGEEIKMTGNNLNKWVRVAISTLTLTVAVGAAVLGPNTAASAFTSTDATNNWNAYNNAFYVGNGGNAYYRVNQGGGQDTNGFWTNAERLEMAIDRAQRSGAAGDKTIVTALVNGFDAQYSTDWSGNTFNDDIMWACIAHLRAYFVTGSTNTAWAVTAANNFNYCYNGGSHKTAQVDGTFGGGMWWTNDHSTATGTKNACVNGPAAIAGYYLSVVFPTGTGFRSQAQALQSWEKSHLVNSSGNVADHYGPGSTGATGFDLSYNSGTYIGASWLLGDSGAAGLAASYYKSLFPGLFQNFGTGGGNNSGFNGIFMRWMALYMYGSGTQSTYSAWLYQNANAALSSENASFLSWDDWSTKTPASGLYSWDCSCTVVALNALNPQTGLSAGIHTLTPGNATGSRLDDNAAGTTNGTKIQIWGANGSAAQNWNFASVGTNTWNLAISLGPYCLDGGAAKVGTATQLWACNGTNDQAWISGAAAQSGAFNFASKQSGLCLDVAGSGTANGTVVQSYTCNGTAAQAWTVN